jgi:hypothetical protein
MDIDLLTAIPIAIALSAACGFRVFIPPLLIGLAARFGVIEPPGHLAWLASWQALTLLLIASSIELIGYYIPWVDNMLDTITTPLAVTAGILLTSNLLAGHDPSIKWALAIIAGGGTAGLVQSSTAALRAGSTGLTGGLGNFIFSTLELLLAGGFTLLAWLVPFLALALCVLAVLALWALIKFVRRKIAPKQKLMPT